MDPFVRSGDPECHSAGPGGLAFAVGGHHRPSLLQGGRRVLLGRCLMTYVPSIPFISMRVAVGLDSTSFKLLRGGRGFEIQSMILETAFASGLVTGVLANFPRACQPRRLRRRLRAENAV
jgi:hypothetical protein